MANRNVDKGREAENACARVLQAHGMLGAERRTKRGGFVELDGVLVPADAGDLTGIPGVVVQVKWSPYRPLVHDMERTEQQRRVAGADVGLLVRKRKGVGLTRAGDWDAYLPAWQLQRLMSGGHILPPLPNRDAVWHTDLTSAAQLLAHAGYGTPVPTP